MPVTKKMPISKKPVTQHAADLAALAQLAHGDELVELVRNVREMSSDQRRRFAQAADAIAAGFGTALVEWLES